MDNTDYALIAARLEEENSQLRRLLEERRASRAATPPSTRQGPTTSVSAPNSGDATESTEPHPKTKKSSEGVSLIADSRIVATSQPGGDEAARRQIEERLSDAGRDCVRLRNEIAQANEVARDLEDALRKEIRDVRKAIRNLDGRA